MNEDGFLEWEEFSTYIVDVVGFEDLNQEVKPADEELLLLKQSGGNLLSIAQS